MPFAVRSVRCSIDWVKPLMEVIRTLNPSSGLTTRMAVPTKQIALKVVEGRLWTVPNKSIPPPHFRANSVDDSTDYVPLRSSTCVAPRVFSWEIWLKAGKLCVRLAELVARPSRLSQERGSSRITSRSIIRVVFRPFVKFIEGGGRKFYDGSGMKNEVEIVINIDYDPAAAQSPYLFRKIQRLIPIVDGRSYRNETNGLAA